MRPRNFLSTSVNFPCGRGTFCQHSVHVQDRSSVSGALRGFLALSAICGVSTRPSCNFWCFGVPFLPLPVQWWPLPSISCVAAIPSDNLWFSSGTFRQLTVRWHPLLSTFGPSTEPFCASTGPSINFPCICGSFHQLSVHPLNLQSTFCASVRPSEKVRTATGLSVNFS